MSKISKAGFIKGATYDARLHKGFWGNQNVAIMQKLWAPEQYFHFEMDGPVPVIHAFHAVNFDEAAEPAFYLGDALRWMKSICNRISQEMVFVNFQIHVCFFDRHYSNLGDMFLFTSDVKRQQQIGPPRFTLHRLDDDTKAVLDLEFLGLLRLYPLEPGQYFYHYYDDTTESGYNLVHSNKLSLMTIVNEQSIPATEAARQDIVQSLGYFLEGGPYRTLLFHYVDYAKGMVGNEFSYPLPAGR